MTGTSKAMVILLAFAAVCLLAWPAAEGQTEDPLPFARDGYTVEKKTVKTSSGEKSVTYRSYKHIPYVAKPVDTDCLST